MTSFSSEEMAAIERRTNAILKGDIKIRTLDLHDGLNREAVLTAIKRCQRLAESLNAKDKDEEQILVDFIETSYPNFFFLTREQYTERTVREYLYRRFKADYQKNPAQLSGLASSLDGDLLFLYRYTSAEDETVTYFEKNIQMPVHLKATMQTRFRLTNAIRLIQKADIDMHILDLGFLSDIFNNVLSAAVRYAVSCIVETYHPDYYALVQYYPQLEEILNERVRQALEPYGILSENIAFKGLSVTDDSQKQFEGVYFYLSKKKLMDEASLSYQEKSMELFEKKAEIINKYPQVEDTLTEAEKDNALSRYLKKNGFSENAGEELSREELRARKINGFGEAIKTPKANDITPPPQANPFKVWFILTLLGVAICAIVAIAGLTSAALFAAAALSLVSGLVYSLKSGSWKRIPPAFKSDSTPEAGESATPVNDNQGGNNNGSN